MDKNILKHLKTEYEELEIKPSANLWERIECGLDSSAETVQESSFQWWKYAAVIILLISVSALFFVDFNSNKKNQNAVAVKQTKPQILNTGDGLRIIEENKWTKKYDHEVSSPEKKNYHSPSYALKSDSFKTNTHIKTEILQPESQTKIQETPTVLASKIEMKAPKVLVAEKKQTAYISADELLLGRELDKTREEARDQKQFGVVDASKLKIKRPNTLRIFGFSVISDTVRTD